MKMVLKKVLVAAALALGAQGALAQQFAGGIPAGWTIAGNAGTSGANGVVTLAPTGASAYAWVSTGGGVNGVSPFGLGSETDGTLLRSPVFSAAAGDPLKFYFNYVTSDGSQFADLAWARLLNAGNLSEAALLFTARTQPSGTIAPGFGLPLPVATLTPPSVPIIPGGPLWSPLGGSSGSCYDDGCGYTGWIESSYAVAGTGDYVLEFGVSNFLDTAYDSGLAFDGVTIAGQVVGQPPVPEPETYAMMLAGLGLLGLVARRRTHAAGRAPHG